MFLTTGLVFLPCLSSVCWRLFELFIGLWTEAEVALCFVVACSLSLPKLIQAKRKHFTRAKTFVSSPFSSSRGARTPKSKSLSLRSTLKGQGTQRSSDGHEHDYTFDRQRAPYSRERYYSEEYGSRLHFVRDRITPSPSSQYSRSVHSRQLSIDDADTQPQATSCSTDADRNVYELAVYAPHPEMGNDSSGLTEPPRLHHTTTSPRAEDELRSQARISRPGRHSRSALEFIALGQFDFGSTIDVAHRPWSVVSEQLSYTSCSLRILWKANHPQSRWTLRHSGADRLKYVAGLLSSLPRTTIPQVDV